MTPVERYAAEVVSYLVRLRRRVRRQIEIELAQELGEYPEAESASALETRFGSPMSYAVDLASNLDTRPGKPRQWTWPRALGAVGGAMTVAWLVAGSQVPVVPGPWHSLGDFDAIEAEPFSEYQGIVFEDGRRGTVIFSLQNRGRFPLTLIDFGIFPARFGEDRQGWAGPLVQEEVSFQLYRETAGGPIGDYQPIIEMLPGDFVSVAVEVLMTNCDTTAAGSTGQGEALVTYSYLGLPRSVLVAVPGIYTTIPDPCR